MKYFLRLLLATLFVNFFLAINCFAQNTVVGLQVNPILPSQVFYNSSIDFPKNNVNFSITPQVGLSAGMVIRQVITDRWNLQTGIQYTQRIYNLQASNDTITAGGKFTFISYEIPVMGLIYIRLGQQTYLSNAFGLSLDFLPSDVSTEGDNYEHVSFRELIAVPALKAQSGFEYRTENSGWFYLGLLYHRQFIPITDTHMRFISSTNTVTENNITLYGHYFGIDVKFFFP